MTKTKPSTRRLWMCAYCWFDKNIEAAKRCAACRRNRKEKGR